MKLNLFDISYLISLSIAVVLIMDKSKPVDSIVCKCRCKDKIEEMKAGIAELEAELAAVSFTDVETTTITTRKTTITTNIYNVG